MSKPLVTIGMPVYNGEEFLAEALDSWLAQEMPDFELVVSDNASTDKTPEILADYASRDSRIHVMTRDETVIAWTNFNGVLLDSAAPVFAWAAHDDLRHPSFLGRLLRALDEDPEVVLAYAQTELFGDERRVKRHADNIDESPGDEPTALGRLIALLRSRQWYATYGLIRTEVLRKTGLFVYPMGFNADCGLCMELATHGRLHCVPERLLRFRLHPKAMSVNPDEPTNAIPGRHFDADARRFAEGFDLPPVEKRIFMRQLEVWCKKAAKPRRHLWRSAGFRSAYVHTSHALIDISRAIHRV